MYQHIDFSAIASEIDCVCPLPTRSLGGRPPFPTALMVRILVMQSLWHLSDEQAEYQRLDRVSCQRFTGLENSSCIPDVDKRCKLIRKIHVSDAGQGDQRHLARI